MHDERKKVQDFYEDDDENTKCPPQDVCSRSRHKSAYTYRNTTQGLGTSGSPDTSDTGTWRRVVSSSARHQDTSPGAEPLSSPGRRPPMDIKRPSKEGADNCKCPPQHITWSSNPNEEAATSHQPASSLHTNAHRYHRQKHRKRPFTERSDHHKATSIKGFLSEDREQIKRETDGHIPGSSPNEGRLSDNARHVVRGFYGQEQNQKCPSQDVLWSTRNTSLWDEEEKEEIKDGDPPDGHIPESNRSEWQNRNEAPGTENDLDTTEKISTQVLSMSSVDQDVESHLILGPDVSPEVGAVDSQAPPPNNSQRRHWSFPPIFPGAFRVGYDEQGTIASNEESTVHVIAQAVDTEAENQIRVERDEAVRELDQLHQMLDNAVLVTPVVATNDDVENRDKNIHADHDDLPRSDDPKCGTRGRPWFAVLSILVIVVAVVVTLALVLPAEPKQTSSEATTTAPTSEPMPTHTQDQLIELISSASSDGGAALADPTTPQNWALEWLTGNPNLTSYSDMEKIQRYALATLYNTTKGKSWENNHDWLSNESVCGNWYQYSEFGDTTINCASNNAVSHLELTFNNLQGSIPPEIGMLSISLDYLALPGNELEGTLPTEIGELTKLTSLSLWTNKLMGTIPSELGLLTKLTYYDLGENKLTGTILTELGLLTKLTSLVLRLNQLTGTVPTILSSLPLLVELYLDENGLTGSLDAFCSMKLESFMADCRHEIECTCCTNCL